MKSLAFASIFALCSVPAMAQSTCPVTLEQAVETAEALGGGMLDLIDVDGAAVDQLLIAEANGLIQVWPVSAGCMVGAPAPIAEVKEPGIPA